MNVAAAQEEGGCPFEDVHSSYSKASNCAQKSGQARLQVCVGERRPGSVTQPRLWSKFPSCRNARWGSGWRSRGDVVRVCLKRWRPNCWSCAPRRAGTQTAAMARTMKRRWTTVNRWTTAMSSSQNLVYYILPPCYQECNFGLILCFSTWFLDDELEGYDKMVTGRRKTGRVSHLLVFPWNLVLWQRLSFMALSYFSGTKGTRRARRLCTERVSMETWSRSSTW